MGASDIRAGGAFVQLGANDSELLKSLERAGESVKKFGAQIAKLGSEWAVLGGSALAPLLGAAKVFAEMGESMALASAKTGIGVESLSTLGYAAKQSGTDMESLQIALLKMNKTLEGTAEGSKKSREVLARLGLSLADLSKLSGEDRFKLFADKLNLIADPGQRAAIAMEVFGKGAAELLPLIGQGSKGIGAMQAQFKALGLQMSGEDAESAAKFSHQLTLMWDMLKNVTFTVGGALAPMLSKGAEAVVAGAASATKWAKEHKQVIVTALLVAAGVTGLGTAVAGLGASIVVAGALITSTLTVVGALLSPLGLIVAGIVAGGAALLAFTNIGSTVMGGLSRVFGPLKAEVLGVFNGIKDALASGNWKTAAQILWAALKVEWDRGVVYLSDAWDRITAPFHSTLNVLRNAWHMFTGIVAKAWHATTSLVMSAWEKTHTFIVSHTGASLWSAFKSGLAMAADYVVYAFSAMEAVITNWRDTLKLVWNSIELGAVKAFETIKYYIMEVIPTAFGWLVGNAPKLFVGLWVAEFEMMVKFFNNVWAYISEMGPKLAALLAKAIIGGLSAGQAFDEAMGKKFMEGFRQDVVGKDGKLHGPQIADRQKSPLELELERNEKADAADLKSKINAAYERNKVALEAMQKAFTAPPGAKNPLTRTAADELKAAQKDLADLLKKATEEGNAPNNFRAPDLKLPNNNGNHFQDLEKSIHVIGSFNAFAFAGGIGVGNGDKQKDLLDEAKESNVLLQKVIDGIAVIGGFTFS